MLNHLVESHVGSRSTAITADLVDKIVYDDPAVLRRLRIDQVSHDFVAKCAPSFKAENAEDINRLMALAEQASEKTPEALEFEEVNDTANDPNEEERSSNYGSAEEKMYDPLVRLFNYISDFGQATTLRRFQKTNGLLKADEPHTFGFPSCSPDFTISPNGVDTLSKSKAWHSRDAFGEVKPSKNQGPKPTNAGTIPTIITQSADSARLFMSARPFMLFCIGFLVFGTEFCVGIFDRDGITFSPIYDMFQNVETFIRVVRRLTCDLSIEELGFDPTVHVLTNPETQQLTGSTKYPSAVVSSGGNDPRQWCTIGPPIWTSPSFWGCGTNVWRVREYVVGVDRKVPFLRGKERILKTAWRSSSARTPESDIYMSIDRPPEGLAKFECGGDVRFAGYPITMRNLRSHPICNFPPEGDTNPPTPVLHRLVLGTVGRPIWEYTSDGDLLTGVRDALQAHKALCDRGILHRDISPGSVLLSDTQNADVPLRGFIIDLESARIGSHTLSTPEVTVASGVGPHDDRGRVLSRTQPTFESTVTVKRGGGMTGTAQFMAQSILLHEIENTTGPIMHVAHHDIESFIWVLSYSVMRKLYHLASHPSAPKDIQDQCHPAFQFLLHQAFGQTTIKAIAAQRQSHSHALRFPRDRDVGKIVVGFMSGPLVALFRDLQGLVHRAADPVNPTPLTHGALLGLIDRTIASLP